VLHPFRVLFRGWPVTQGVAPGSPSALPWAILFCLFRAMEMSNPQKLKSVLLRPLKLTLLVRYAYAFR
jgi:hypothetical protein